MCMRKVYFKLIALSLMLVISVSMVVAVSYAWVVMSTSPEISGLQVTIGGGNTILVAPDVSNIIDGVTYHYPGKFDEKLNFGQHASYDYLEEVESLMPVSTADGIHWFLPAYYDGSDPMVQDGRIQAGQIKDIREFTLETDLTHANLTDVEEEELIEGSYVYLDFWVVSPGTDCTLRVSVPTLDGDNSGGSFLLEQPNPENGKFTLHRSHAAAMFRVGFLANTDMVLDDSMLYYLNSIAYDQDYRSLRGWYAEPGVHQYGGLYERFTIYEPNADYHPGLEGMDGMYLVTDPIGLQEDEPAAVSVLDRVTAQKKSDWITLDNGQLMLEQIFQSAIIGKEGMESAELRNYFYDTYLQGQVEHFVNKGAFVKRSENLTDQLILDPALTAGATDDVYIVKLDRNIPQRIRMFVWLEGQDADCTNLTKGVSMMLNLEFAGSTASELAGE